MKARAKNLMLAALLAASITGCGKGEPTLAGGKPIGYWVEAIKGADPKIRREAAFKLGNVGPTDAAALSALIGAIRDRDARVRCEVILALVKFGPDAKEAAAELANLKQNDGDARVRDYASKALVKIDGEMGK